MGGPDAAPRREPVHAAGGSTRPMRTAVEAAYDQFQRELYTFAVHATRDMNVAEDIVQEAYLRLHRELLAGRRPTTCAAGCSGSPATS